jgi:hypothetical protein
LARQRRLPQWSFQYVNDGPLHFTLRRTQAHFSNGRTWLGIALVGALIGLVGPFNTFQYVTVLPRLLYWFAIAAGSYAIGFCCAIFFEAWLGRGPLWRHFLLTGLLPGIPIALFVIVINLLTFGPTGGELIGLATLLVYCPLIALGITVASHVLGAGATAPAEPAEQAAPPALLARLPHAMRGRLLHLAVADHYVDVTTDKGHELVLMRLSDAIAETAPQPGLQVHRSHWVALNGVKRGLRQSGKPMLELENGTLVPVSRSYLPAARAAGLLP